jgi:hypothetical protein
VAVRPSGKGSKGKGYEVLVAQHRGWDYTAPECKDLDDD